jgi:hypothetical protein
MEEIKKYEKTDYYSRLLIDFLKDKKIGDKFIYNELSEFAGIDIQSRKGKNILYKVRKRLEKYHHIYTQPIIEYTIIGKLKIRKHLGIQIMDVTGLKDDILNKVSQCQNREVRQIKRMDNMEDKWGELSQGSQEELISMKVRVDLRTKINDQMPIILEKIKLIPSGKYMPDIKYFEQIEKSL